jgi:hypothetical protein
VGWVAESFAKRNLRLGCHHSHFGSEEAFLGCGRTANNIYLKLYDYLTPY